MRVKDMILNLSSLVLIGAGVALLATFLLPPSLFGVAPKGRTASAQQGAQHKEADASEPASEAGAIAKAAPREAREGKEKERGEKPEEKKAGGVPKADGVPKNEKLRLTIPKMARIGNDVVPSAGGADEEKLRNYAAVHLEGTGFPWQKGANVYIAGHRLGYPSTDSFLAFWDLDKLQAGDRILLTDANGTKYVYRVFKEKIVAPKDVSITKPVEGKNVVTLQTCTLPNYNNRLIVQAERVDRLDARGHRAGTAR